MATKPRREAGLCVGLSGTTALGYVFALNNASLLPRAALMLTTEAIGPEIQTKRKPKRTRLVATSTDTDKR